MRKILDLKKSDEAGNLKELKDEIQTAKNDLKDELGPDTWKYKRAVKKAKKEYDLKENLHGYLTI